MPLGLVQATPESSVDNLTSVSVTFNTAPKFGNAIVLAVVKSGSAPTPTACTDNKANSYPRVYAMNPPFANGGFAIYMSACTLNVGSPFTITVTDAAPADFVAVGMEIGGVNDGLILDGLPGGIGSPGPQQGNSVNPAATASTGVASDIFAIGLIGINSVAQSSITVGGTGWTQLAEKLGPPHLPCEIDWKIQPGGNPTVGWTLSTADWWNAGIASFRAGSGTAPTSSEVGIPTVLLTADGVHTLIQNQIYVLPVRGAILTTLAASPVIEISNSLQFTNKITPMLVNNTISCTGVFIRCTSGDIDVEISRRK